MKTLLLIALSIGLLALDGCSKWAKQETNVNSQSTSDTDRLKADSKRLQQATANAAKERAKEKVIVIASPTPTAHSKADNSPLTVPPTSPNPNP